MLVSPPRRAESVRVGRSVCVPRIRDLRQQAHHEALQQARTSLSYETIVCEQGKLEYKKRAGIEGSLSQGVRRFDLR